MPALTLVIGNYNYSSWSLRPWLFLKQHGIEFETLCIPLYTPQSREQLGKYSPSGKVPVLLHEGTKVWDSLAICEYASETFLEGRGWPAEPAARAMARSISAEMHSGFADLRNNFSVNCRRRPMKVSGYSSAVKRDIDRICTIWRECRSLYAAKGPWLFGEFSIADAMYAPVCLRFRTYGFPIGDVEQAYVRTVLELPAMRHWMEQGVQEEETLEQFEVVN
jgi:glutathione S-transferase